MIELLIDHNKDIVEMFRWTRGNELAHWIGYANGTYKAIMPAEDALAFKLRFKI